MKEDFFNPYLGRNYSKECIEEAMKKYDNIEAVYTEEYIEKTAKLISDGNIIGWYQGAAEIGPRALGNRSILADPRNEDMKHIINKRVKFREAFRPFAPSVLWEYQQEYFDLNIPNPYMLMACDVHKNKQKNIPAVTHVDGTARVQTVMKNINSTFYKLIEAFYEITNVPVLLNTSFNVKGEPIVETPDDAIKCFLGTGIDYMVIDKFIISKKN